MNNFIFQNTTKVYFGDQISALGEEIAKYGKKVLLTYGGGSIKRNGIYDAVVGQLRKINAEIYELPGIEPNPRHTTVNKGAEICKKNGIEVLLAVGGGSTIDCTKAIAAAAYYDGDSWDLVIGKAPVVNALPVLTVLTLSATGSEMDCGGVISNIQTKDKFGLVHPLLQPKVSFLNPEYTFSVNEFQTACGAADIIAHIFDCYYFTMQKKLDMTDTVMENIIRTVIKYAPIAIREPKNIDARANLMWASSWALNGFLSTGIGLDATCHAIEHELSAFYDITHGLGLAIIMPRWLEYVLDDDTAPTINKFGVNVFGLKKSESVMDGAKKAIEKLKEFLYETLGLASTLSAIGINDNQFEVMAKKACGSSAINGFTVLTPKDITEILKKCL